MDETTRRATPRPWRAGRGGTVVGDAAPIGYRGTAEDIGYYGGFLVAESLSAADTDLITRAVNSHDRLVAALEFILNDAAPGEDAVLSAEGYNRACAALALARGESPVAAHRAETGIESTPTGFKIHSSTEVQAVFQARFGPETGPTITAKPTVAVVPGSDTQIVIGKRAESRLVGKPGLATALVVEIGEQLIGVVEVLTGPAAGSYEAVLRPAQPEITVATTEVP